MTAIEKAVRTLQKAMGKRFGSKPEKDYTGQSTLFITGHSADMTNEHGTFVVRGPVRVATVLRRKRRTK